MFGWKIAVFFVSVVISGCAVERALIAHDAQDKMIGLSKEQVLACMGVPSGKMAEGATEVWSYGSGNGRVTGIANTYGTAQASAVGGPGYAYGNASGNSTTITTATQRHCTVNIVMANGHVSHVNYSGPTGGLLTQGEQCAFAVQNCAR